MTRPSPMPIIHTSLASAIPCWVGKGVFSLRIPGVLAYRPSRPPENAASPAPATADGMTGTSSAEPSAISHPARSRTKSRGLSFRSVQAEQAAGERRQPRARDGGRDDGHQQRRAERDLAPRQEPDEIPGLELRQERISAHGEPVELGGGLLVRGEFADAGVEDERASRDALREVPCLDRKPHIFLLFCLGKLYLRKRWATSIIRPRARVPARSTFTRQTRPDRARLEASQALDRDALRRYHHRFPGDGGRGSPARLVVAHDSIFPAAVTTTHS